MSLDSLPLGRLGMTNTRGGLGLGCVGRYMGRGGGGGLHQVNVGVQFPSPCPGNGAQQLLFKQSDQIGRGSTLCVHFLFLPRWCGM